MPEIRQLTEDDFKESLELSQYAFQYKVPESDLPKRKEGFKKHEVWGEFDQGRLTSKLHILSLQVFLGEQPISMGGIAGVATWPEYRRNGSVSRLINQSLQSMKDKGQSISFLHPFDFHFYRRFGWEFCFSQKKVTVEKKDLHFMKAAPGKVSRITDELTPVYEMYESFTKKYNGMLKRDLSWWQQSIVSPEYQFVIYTNEAGTPTGYLLFKNAEKLLDVQEFVYLDEEARRGLWNFICQHDSMVDKVELVLTEDDQLPFLLRNPKVKIEIVPYFMARIVDAKAFLSQYPFLHQEGELVLHIKDEQAEWNCTSLKLSNGEISEASSGEQGLTLDIQSLTAVLLRAQKAQFLHEVGSIQGNLKDIQLLSESVPNRNTSLVDFF
ncbi:putative acetyltransferase [Bacillus mesophilus]|uniref:GNAT family N-acetyltransferase n=1 Tax=Bacillus mesophilus TaxID=1808955 RepID=A0A6M0Q9G8_9BACI|nr:GNAT family N-acetyltransferase [Bacillus mesophilus]MBM7662377.1 putative acetyltransferase [Bacillus mesophilus]NEY72994.1 GNAT family N-acetyltransferase [Bacillus mesophilus]